MLQMQLISSLHRVFPQRCPENKLTTLSGMANEPLSFQAAYRLEGTVSRLPVYFQVESDLPVSCYRVGYLPVIHIHPVDGAEPKEPGLYPDLLEPKRRNPPLYPIYAAGQTHWIEKDDPVRLNAAADTWQTVWFTVNEKGKNLKPGKYPVTVRFFSGCDRSLLAEACVEIEIIGAKLPKQSLMYTNWLHCDCLADYYHEEMFSDRFFEILENYVSVAAENGMNMVLMPAFTPALDTPIGRERRRAQLVDISVKEDGYHFDFTRLKRFIDLCRKAGIEYFEHAHLFSQWGATSAPTIYATVNGQDQRIFGWKSKASGKKYGAFLQAYLPKLRAFLRTEGLEKKTLFHISDEPNLDQQADYRKAVAQVRTLLEGCMVGDALSHYEFYEDGTVQIPIVSTRTVMDFVGKCDRLWTYYTGGNTREGLSNRLLHTPPEENRILGVEMYHLNIRGFLHWGYNFYYDVFSQGMFDPKVDPCGYRNLAGTSYFVYPGKDGTALRSTRQKVFYEGINDMRALQLLEKKKGRAFCDALIRKHFGELTTYTKAISPEQLLQFREELNHSIF